MANIPNSCHGTPYRWQILRCFKIKYPLASNLFNCFSLKTMSILVLGTAYANRLYRTLKIKKKCARLFKPPGLASFLAFQTKMKQKNWYFKVSITRSPEIACRNFSTKTSKISIKVIQGRGTRDKGSFVYHGHWAPIIHRWESRRWTSMVSTLHLGNHLQGCHTSNVFP